MRQQLGLWAKVQGQVRPLGRWHVIDLKHNGWRVYNEAAPADEVRIYPTRETPPRWQAYYRPTPSSAKLQSPLCREFKGAVVWAKNILREYIQAKQDGTL